MLEEIIYLSEPGCAERVMELTGLAEDELEVLVKGRYTGQSQWAGKLRGALEVYVTGRMVLRHNFKRSEKYWENLNEQS